MEGFQRHVERLSAASGVELRLEDLPTSRFKPGVWHPVLNDALARCARREVAWRTTAEALAALEAACEAHVQRDAPQPPAQPPLLQTAPETQQETEAAYEARLAAFVRSELATRRRPVVLLSTVGQLCSWAGPRGKYAQFIQARPHLFRLVRFGTAHAVWLTQWTETDYVASLAAVLHRAPGCELQVASLATQCPMTPEPSKRGQKAEACGLDQLLQFLRARPHLFELVPHESPGHARVRLATAQVQAAPPLQPPPQLEVRSKSPAAEAAAAKSEVQAPSQLLSITPAQAAVAAPSSWPKAPAAISSPTPSVAARSVISDAAAAVDPPAAPTATSKAPQRRSPLPSRRRFPSPRITRAAGDGGDDRARKRSRSRERRSRSRSSSRKRDRRSRDAPAPRGHDERRRRGSRSRSRSRGRDHRRSEDYWRRREASPPRRDRDHGHGGVVAPYATTAPHATPQMALPQPLPLPQQVPAPPPPLPSLPAAMSLPIATSATSSAGPMVMPQVQYRSTVTCGLLPATAAPIAVVGTPLSGDPALPRPLALGIHVPASQVESLSAQLPPSRHSVVAFVGEDDASTIALRALAAQLAAPSAQPGGEAWAVGVVSSDGAAHFFLPPSAAANRLILAASSGVPPPQFIAEGIAVSFLLTDAAVAAAQNRRAVMQAALQAAAASRLSAVAQQLHA